MTDTLTAPSWQSSVLESVPSGFLAHDWQPATGGRTFEVRNPATEEVIATVADCGTQDALSALDAAAAAADQWALTSPRDRATVLHRLTDAMVGHRERLARIITLEIGKTIIEARGRSTTPQPISAGTPRRRSATTPAALPLLTAGVTSSPSPNRSGPAC